MKAADLMKELAELPPGTDVALFATLELKNAEYTFMNVDKVLGPAEFDTCEGAHLSIRIEPLPKGEIEE